MIPSFEITTLESICNILGNTTDGFTGSAIGRYLKACNIPDTQPTFTNWKRLFEALKDKQRSDECGNNIAVFIQYVMNPVLHVENTYWFDETLFKLNNILAFEGYELGKNGKLSQVNKADTHSAALARLSRLKTSLVNRKVHSEVMKYCRQELLVDNYFHAVFEATKSIAERIRGLTGLRFDGSLLVDEAFSFQNKVPYLAFNTLSTESEQSEQKGFMNLLKGVFGTFRNTTAHAPKITWKIEEQDALDILSLISLIHRRLDLVIQARAMYEGKVKN